MDPPTGAGAEDLFPSGPGKGHGAKFPPIAEPGEFGGPPGESHIPMDITHGDSSAPKPGEPGFIAGVHDAGATGVHGAAAIAHAKEEKK
jgi:hypothetical protein